MKTNCDVIVIGAGAAGLFAALTLKNKKVLVLEKNSVPGKKLLITGLGQCNYTNSCSPEEYLNKFGSKGKFLKPAFYRFNNEDAISFFESLGVESTVRDDGKVFPQSMKATDILDCLLAQCKNAGVSIKCDVIINKVKYDEELCSFEIYTGTDMYIAQNLIIATGGMSYPNTGSTGDGYVFAHDMGHKIEDKAPALTPVYVKNYCFGELSGISFKDANITLWRNNKKINNFNGDLLFTHRNLSGPVIIDNSRYIMPNDMLRVNFTNFVNKEEFKKHFEKRVMENGKSAVKTIIKEFNLPKRFVEKIMELAGLNDETNCSQLNKEVRNKVVEMLSDMPMNVEALGNYNVAMVTRGGVSTTEINAKTMESKIIKGLYFAGEVIDIDGNTGGYNLQAAFSTGRLAGESINAK